MCKYQFAALLCLFIEHECIRLVIESQCKTGTLMQEFGINACFCSVHMLSCAHYKVQMFSCTQKTWRKKRSNETYANSIDLILFQKCSLSYNLEEANSLNYFGKTSYIKQKNVSALHLTIRTLRPIHQDSS